MEKIDRYREAILMVLIKYDSCYPPSNKAIKSYLIIDQENDHYQLMRDERWRNR